MKILYDNSPIPQDLLECCRNMQRLTEAGQCSLVNLMDPAGPAEPPEIFRLGPRPRTGNLVGQFECRDPGGGPVQRVIIAGRFGPAAQEGPLFSLFVQEMLRSCWGETPFWLLNEPGNRETEDCYNRLLALRLAAQTSRAWKHGRLRLYRTVSRYDSRVQGRLDLPRKIRRSMGLQDGAMAYQVREFSGDNPYNQLFYQACLTVQQWYPLMMETLLQRIPGFRAAFQDLAGQSGAWRRADSRSLLAATRKRIVNPIYRDYDTLRGIARAVLQRLGGLQQAENPVPIVTGVFLDVSELWERYLARRVLPAPPEVQQTHSILGGRMNIRPDFLWPGRAVLDAKYRPAWGRTLGQPWGEELREDVYQLLSYMLALNCSRGGVIFPVSGFAGASAGALPVSESGGSFWRFPFFVPAVPDPEAFRKELAREEARVAGQLRPFIECI